MLYSFALCWSHGVAMQTFLLSQKKYEYGYTFRDELGFNILGGEPMFHPLIDSEEYTFLYPGYMLNDEENRYIQSKKTYLLLCL